MEHSDFAAYIDRLLPPLYWGELLRLLRSGALTEAQRHALQSLMDDYRASRQPSVLRCQGCGMESTRGPWAVLRERA